MQKLYNIIKVIILMSFYQVLLPITAYCLKDAQSVSLTRREIYFELKTDKTKYERGDSIIIYFKIKNKSKLPAWFIDDTLKKEPLKYTANKNLITIDFGLGDDVINISDYAPKYVELKPGHEIKRIYRFNREEVVLHLEKINLGDASLYVNVRASIAYFDQGIINIFNMQYICKERSKGTIHQLREGDSGRFWFSVNRVDLSGIMFLLN